MTLEKIGDHIQRVLDEKEAVREVALKSSRAVVRLCSSTIQRMHKGGDASVSLAEARGELERLKGVLSEHPEFEHAGFVDAAYQEFTEAAVLQAIIGRRPLPGPTELGVTPQAYLEGIGDVVGEVRRLALDRLMHGDVAGAIQRLELMDELYVFLMRFDYPAALAGVKRKQDVARQLVERTRGDVAVASRAHSLEMKLAEPGKKRVGAKGGKKRL